ncbi:MAG TPA: asparagine synthase (glutamine-hydrolyzing), partial [Oleiagrimonas sp.]|nr:asparagine synthase (glutamine-hydrolyzing) [Oleiagrimonas sp.]
MCGFVAVLDPDGDVTALRPRVLAQARSLRHRGPDWSGVQADPHAILAHERLAIVDVQHGAQPLVSMNGQHVLAVNGEIYNHRELRADFAVDTFRTDSDCEVLLPLYAAHVDQSPGAWLNRVNGMFAFVLWDRQRNDWLIARDPIGVIPLYTGRDAEDRLWVASELKALAQVCVSVETFPPGCWQSAAMTKPARYYQPTWRAYSAVEYGPEDPAALRAALEASVHRHLMSDVPYGVLLSGGLDSSLVVALMQAQADRSVRTYSIGFSQRAFDEAPFAAEVARHLGTDHTTLVMGESDVLAMVPRMPDVYDEPFADSSQLPTCMV